MSDHSLFSRCSKQGGIGRCGCGSSKGGGDSKRMFSWLCRCGVNLILVSKLCWLSIITGGEEAKTFSCSSAKSNLAGEITLNLSSGRTELRC